MKKLSKMIAAILAAVMLIAYTPLADCYAAGLDDYASATEIKFNKLYMLE